MTQVVRVFRYITVSLCCLYGAAAFAQSTTDSAANTSEDGAVDSSSPSAAENATANDADDDPVLAKINGHAVLLSDIYRQIETIPLGDQLSVRSDLNKFIESVIREEVLFQSVLASDFEGDAALREKIKAEVVEHLIKREVTDKIVVTDKMVSDFYTENTLAISGASVAASQIVRPTREECEALLPTIDTIDEFRKQAREVSKHKFTAEKDGDMGLLMYHNSALGFEESLFDMKPGEMRIFETEQGCHLVRVTDREDPPIPPLEDVADQITALLSRQQEIDLLKSLFSRVEHKVTIERFQTDDNEPEDAQAK